jgi:dihydropyrimidine dehydrogenase (NAD+) subunit PreA
MREAIARETIAMTPIPKLDHGATGGGNEPYATPLARIPRVDEDECVGCNLCALVCPVEGCITMERVDTHLPAQSWEQRMGNALNPARKSD